MSPKKPIVNKKPSTKKPVKRLKYPAMIKSGIRLKDRYTPPDHLGEIQKRLKHIETCLGSLTSAMSGNQYAIENAFSKVTATSLASQIGERMMLEALQQTMLNKPDYPTLTPEQKLDRIIQTIEHAVKTYTAKAPVSLDLPGDEHIREMLDWLNRQDIPVSTIPPTGE